MKHTVKKLVSKTLHMLPVTKGYLDESRLLREVATMQGRHIEFLEDQLRSGNITTHSVKSDTPHIRFITNQLDSTGAPLIFMDMVRDFVTQNPDMPSELHSFLPVRGEFIDSMRSLGIEVVVHDQHNTAIRFAKGDVLVMNTVAYTAELKNSVYEALENGTVTKLLWYIHEDWPHIFFDTEEQRRIRSLIDGGKISIFIPAKQALSNHQKLYAGKRHTHLLPYRFALKETYHQVREADDFDTLRFVMVGKTGEGLKGHLPILYAFLTFKAIYMDKNPEIYREFELRFIGIEQDYLSLQILKHAGGLGKRFTYYPPQPHDKALDIIKASNVTICYSLRECLPMFVYEGMLMGHPILRNDVSGAEEQLKQGENGFLLDGSDYRQLVDVLERMLNRKMTSAGQLAKMSRCSHDLAVKLAGNSYDQLTDEALAAFAQKNSAQE